MIRFPFTEETSWLTAEEEFTRNETVDTENVWEATAMKLADSDAPQKPLCPHLSTSNFPAEGRQAGE